MKKCNGPCQQVKEDSEFGNRTMPNGIRTLRSFCKPCNNAAKADWVHKNWAKDTARNNAYNKANAARIRGHKLRKYWPGTTPEQANANFEALLASQDGKCAICTAVRFRGWHVDHDHITGKVRGILCNQCNRGLGLFKDSEPALTGAIAYLTRHKNSVS